MRDPTDDEKRRIENIRRVALSFKAPKQRSTGPRGRQHPDVTRAQTARRTAAYRDRIRSEHRPTVEAFGRALVYAIATAPKDTAARLVAGELLIINSALKKMIDKGYDPQDVFALLRRIRKASRRRTTKATTE